jgi:hypothetical protein
MLSCLTVVAIFGDAEEKSCIDLVKKGWIEKSLAEERTR